jgi:hypothetical protein
VQEIEMKQVRWLAILSLTGGAMAVPLLIAFFIIEGGAVGTAAYQRYELLNRLMAVALVFMAAGWVGVWQVVGGYGRWAAHLAFIGVLIMALGTAAEFWLYSDLPYNGESMRQVAYSTTSIGGWLLNLGAMAVGSTIWRSRIWPRWSTIILLLALPFDIAAYFLLNSPFVTATIVALLLSWFLLRNDRPFKLQLPNTR